MANVLNRITKQYLISVNTPDYPENDWIINPDLTTVLNVPSKYWKIVDNDVSEMSQEEKNQVDLDALQEKDYEELEFDSKNRLQYERIYSYSNESGMHYLANDIEYVYSGNKLLREIKTNYDVNGSVINKIVIGYNTIKDTNIRVVQKKPEE